MIEEAEILKTIHDAWLAAALIYKERFGFSVIPMGEDKKPMIKWAELQDRRATTEEILSWERKNLAIVTGAISGIVVVDCESPEDAKWFWDNRGKTTAMVKTKRGFHLYFKHPGQRVPNGQKIENRYDVRGDGGYVLAPPSSHSEGSYKWHKPLISVAELPVFNMDWRPASRFTYDDKKVFDGVKYISTIHAVSGSGGHNDTYRAACTLRESGLSEGEALLALQDWNRTNADPPWSDRELLHKVRYAYSEQ
jgi:hypothetical protein